MPTKVGNIRAVVEMRVLVTATPARAVVVMETDIVDVRSSATEGSKAGSRVNMSESSIRLLFQVELVELRLSSYRSSYSR